MARCSEVYKENMPYVINEVNKPEKTTGTGMAKSIEFVFQFPPIQGVFDTGYGVVYIFGTLHENEIEDIIVHETLHYVLQKVAGKRTSLKLDRVHDKVLLN